MNIRKGGDIHIAFHCESADRSVGIMAEGFCAWTVKVSDDKPHMIPADSCQCMIVDYNDDFASCKFVWSDGDTDDECSRPTYAAIVEHALHGFAKGMYANEEELQPSDPNEEWDMMYAQDEISKEEWEKGRK